MDEKKLRRLRRELAVLRNGVANMPSRKLERFAGKLGRHPSKTGKEHTWVSHVLPQSRPISIPHHSRPLNKYTADNILDLFEKDLFDIERLLEKTKTGGNHDKGGEERSSRIP